MTIPNFATLKTIPRKAIKEAGFEIVNGPDSAGIYLSASGWHSVTVLLRLRRTDTESEFFVHGTPTTELNGDLICAANELSITEVRSGYSVSSSRHGIRNMFERAGFNVSMALHNGTWESRIESALQDQRLKYQKEYSK